MQPATDFPFDGSEAGIALWPTVHRPFSPPARPWFMYQQWEHLLFAHWPISPQQLDGLIPEGLTVDLFEESAWLTVTPFLITGARLRWLPSVGSLFDFPEMNVRTYVALQGMPGVYFFRLDAANRLAVAGARILYHLPYYHARMRIDRENTGYHYRSARHRDDAGASAAWKCRYTPTGAAGPAQPGSVEHFLAERYCLYAGHDGAIYRAHIHHPPWHIQPVEAEIEQNQAAEAAGIRLPPTAPICNFSRMQRTVIWLPELVDAR
ncbi:MAG TPA: DUF2071 domain-containing protein [Chthonomonadales bacterium]|nr:DUF2071 domain-containing protein [Chthonomonadales bacterium]